jgi:hypothetical protein
MSETIAYIVIAVVLLFATAGLNSCTNDMAKTRCEAKGGEFYKAVDAGHSLCKLPQKEN